MMRIGELSAHAGIAASAIRYYESLGLLPRPRRESSRRVYSPDAASYLAVIRLARACGFRLNEIALLMRGLGQSSQPSTRWKTMAASKRLEIDQAIKQLEAMRRLLGRVESCRCKTILECGKLARQPL